MDKERFKKITSNKNFIPGIYNYCDRWCEKCAFTSRCSNYAVSQEIFDKVGNDNEKIFEALSNIFRITMELIEETAKELNIDISEIKSKSLQNKSSTDEEDNHPPLLIQLSRQYAKKVSSWFEEHQEDLQAKENEFKDLWELGANEEEIKQQADELKDFIDVIYWYQYFIEVKLHRALPGRGFQTEISFEGMEDDMNGSAKVALIAIDRSIGAWGKFLEYFPEAEDSIFEILILLNNIRKSAEERFPDARKFIRPGLDE